MLADRFAEASALVGLLCALALCLSLITLWRLNSIDVHRTCARICIGVYAKFAGHVCLLFGGLDWFLTPTQALFRWLLLIGSCLILTGDGLLSLRWVRGKWRRDRRRLLQAITHGRST